jgi:DNA-binding transcriptional LysR family regulator
LGRRCSRNCRLTGAGEEILEFAEQMEASSNRMEARVFGRDQSVRGLLRVALPPPVATHLLMPDFVEFAQLHPEIEMEIAAYIWADTCVAARDAQGRMAFHRSSGGVTTPPSLPLSTAL